MATISSTALASVTAFTDAANEFAAAVQDSNTSNVSSFQALTMLNGLPALCVTAIDAIRGASTAPEAGDLVTQCEELLYDCNQLGNFYFTTQVNLKDWVVPQDMTLMVAAQMLYGADADQHLEEMLANNPQVAGLILIPAGTKLVVNTLTVS